MKKHKGFTIVEVALFLAITGALFMGIVAGTSNSIQQQRFYDATQTFAEFLRSIYSQVSNPQSVGDGRSNEAIYGKLIVFGEGEDLNGNTNTDQEIYTYDVIGNANLSGSGQVVDSLRAVGANVVRPLSFGENGEVTKIEPVGENKVFVPRWGMSIEEVELDSDGKFPLFTGSILVVRHPRSGTINTLINKNVIGVNKMVKDYNGGSREFKPGTSEYKYESLLTDELSNFEATEVDFCINQYGNAVQSDNRWDVRMVSNARNGSGVEIIGLDADEVVGGIQVGNRCRFDNET